MHKFTSKALAAIGTLALITIAVAIPGIPAGSASAQGIGQATYGGVTFSYDKSLATDVRGRIVPGTTGEGGIVSEIRPEHMSFAFDGYPSKGAWTPQIRVIPRAAYESAQAVIDIRAELSALERYLAGETGVPLPHLPIVNAARIISENVAPIAGAGGSGVRFVAAYSQGIAPVGADNITYIYIGLTTDRNYYVEGTFPLALSTPLDPAPSPVTTENAQAYNQTVADRLGKTDAAGFRPNLDNLDKMMSSLQVNRSAIPGMPTTGAGTSQYEGLIFAMLALAAVLILAGLATSVRTKVRP